MDRTIGFSPEVGDRPLLLILGTMPGKKSLDAQQYYAHPQNAFWRIMHALVGLDPAASYKERINTLKVARVALWDVLESCQRKGSSDSAIQLSRANDFAAFFKRYPTIQLACLNGLKAANCYKRSVVPDLADGSPSWICVPSSSPAHARMSLHEKIAKWRAATRPIS